MCIKMTNLTEILEEKHVFYKKTNNPVEILIKCTHGTHTDENPSLSYNLENNIFHCWSCGFSGGKEKFLKSIGIQTKLTFDNKQPYKIQKIKHKIRKLLEKNTIELPTKYQTAKGMWKNISTKTITEFKTFFTEEYGLNDYICIPIYQFHKLRFIEARHRFGGKSKPKYLRRPAGASVLNVLFPLDKLAPTSEVIIVEGLFDMLNLWQHGYRNTLCTFGTQSFGEKKVRLLDELGVTSVQIMMDGDSAGSLAAKKIKRLLEKNDFQTNIIQLAQYHDPGDLSPDEIKYYLSNSN